MFANRKAARMRMALSSGGAGRRRAGLFGTAFIQWDIDPQQVAVHIDQCPLVLIGIVWTGTTPRYVARIGDVISGVARTRSRDR